MIDSPTGRNLADFKQRYQGVVGWLRQPNSQEKVAVFVSNVNSSKVTFKDASDAEYYANVDAGVQFEFIPTQRAWYNTKDATYLVQRVPARQWKRGICSENTSFQKLTGDVLMIPDEAWTTIAFKVMSTVLNVKELVPAYLMGQRSSVALSKHFAIGGSSLYFINLKIGEVNRNKGTITLSPRYEMVRQELTDVLTRNNFSFKVTQ